MSIAFPEVTASLRADGVTAGLDPERILVVGQQTQGTATSGALQQNILSEKTEDGLFGENSPIAAAIRRIRLVNSSTILDAIGLKDNDAGVASEGAANFTGTATAPGNFTVFIGSKKINKYVLPVASGDTATMIGEALVSALSLDSKALVLGVNTAGTVVLSATTTGTFGNTIGIRVEGEVAGLTVALTALTNGATDPVLIGVFDVVGKQRYQGIVWQFDQDVAPLTAFLDPRFNISNDILDGVGFISITDTLANHLTSLGSHNSKSLSYNAGFVVNDSDHRGPAILDLPFVQAAEFVGIRGLRRTDGAVLGDYVISRSSGDSFGGMHTNSKPYANTPFFNLLTPDVGDSFTNIEIAQLKDAGAWVIDANRAYANVIAGEVVTTYLTDVAGNPDPSFGFLNYVDSASVSREYIVNNTRAQYPQYRATGGALPPNLDAANEASIAAFVAEKYSELGVEGLVNTGVGTVNGEQVDYDKLFRENLTVSLNTVTGRFSVALKLYIVVQLRAIIYDMAVSFEI